MKTYYLTLSQVFPAAHSRAGEQTGFREKVLKSVNEPWRSDIAPKVHTIRANYNFWRRRFEKIADGRACLSIREWVGKPYGKGSTQREIVRLTREDGIGLQKLTIAGCRMTHPMFVDGHSVSAKQLAANDGLSEIDWRNWFWNYDLTEPLAVIQFTKFRY